MVTKHITMGILAHVDAGKTTLSEAILYLTGAIRKIGRVDHRDAFLDTDEIERARGITVFSKEARFAIGEKEFTLLDTPGHSDFSSETERALQVMDYAILVVSATDGVQAHTLTLHKLLMHYNVPTFIFVNKTDLPCRDRREILAELSEQLGGGVFAGFGGLADAGFGDLADAGCDDGAGRVEGDGSNRNKGRAGDEDCKKDEGRKIRANRSEDDSVSAGCVDDEGRVAGEGRKIRANGGGQRCVFDEYNAEEIASASEELMEEYLTEGCFCEESIISAIEKCQLVPVFFGSALKLSGVEKFIEALGRFTAGKEYGDEFGARVYKIDRDKQGNRLTHLKVTGGTVRNKMIIEGCGKIEQIRLYNGENFQSVQSAGCGMVCAVLGPAGSYAGQGLGCEGSRAEPVLAPALACEVILAATQDPVTALAKLRQLAEEEPSLKVLWNEERRSISVQVMGELELEILKQVISRRFDMDVSFGSDGIIYKETIAEPVIGIGHYEPLRHYAEVQLLLEPLPAGSGLVFGSLVSEDKFARNWQRLVMTHLSEKAHRGVLTGSEITDMRISIAAGRAHPKHTEGGDFRQATYRALRQGLRMAKSVLLEPVYAFRLRLPQEAAGRALTDLSRLGAKAALSEAGLITGTGPVRTLRDYAKEVAAYTKGKGVFSAVPDGYMPCEDQDQIIAQIGYDADADLENPAGSVFCEHGSAVYVNWDEVATAAHLEPEAAARRIASGTGEAAGETKQDDFAQGSSPSSEKAKSSGITAGNDELEAIFLRTYGKSKRDEALRRASLSRGMDRPAAAGAGAQPAARQEARNANSGNQQNAAARREKDPAAQEKPLFIIDGYNVIFAWEELSQLAKVNIDSAREALIDLLGNYMGYRNIDIALIFDGYRLAGNPGTKTSYTKLSDDSGQMQVVYTKEAQTADRFIEKAVFELGRKRRVTVITSDRPVQMAALGDGAARMSAREFYAEIKNAEASIRERLGKQTVGRNRPLKVIENIIIKD